MGRPGFLVSEKTNAADNNGFRVYKIAGTRQYQSSKVNHSHVFWAQEDW